MDGIPFGRYQLIEILGRGGMGEVWRSYDTVTDRVVAVKILAAELAQDAIFEHRFQREVRMAAALNEPHVVPIHNYGRIDGRLFVDMRLIEATDLQTLVRRGRLDAERAVTVIEQVAAALSAAHRVGLVHRNVKPSNILVGEYDYAYLIGFGVARTPGEQALTDTDSVVGTGAYTAPERFGDGERDAHSDTYALACVLHECLTGGQPYPGTSHGQMVSARFNSPPSKLSETVPGLPRALDVVIANGIAEDPHARYPSTTALAAAARAAITAPAPPTEFADAGSVEDPRTSRGPHRQNRQSNQTRHTMSKALIGIAVLAVVAIIVGGVAINKLSSTPTDVAKPDNPPAGVALSVPPASPDGINAAFSGTFQAVFGAPSYFNGEPRDMDYDVVTATWVIRASCDEPGCIATATRTDGYGYSDTVVFDNVGGKWLTVNEIADDEGCYFNTDNVWEVVSLTPRPDGTFTGDWSAAWSSESCNLKRNVTFTRTEEADAAVDVADPEGLEPRVISPAEGLRGRYLAVQTADLDGSTFEDIYRVRTDCLRDGTRCISLSYALVGDSAMVYSENRWIFFNDKDVACALNPNLLAHEEYRVEYPLPQPVQNPIETLLGTGHFTSTGGCPADEPYKDRLERLGD